MTGEQIFIALVIVLVLGVVCDHWFGAQMQHRRRLQIVIVVLYALVLFAVPSCQHDDGDRPDGPEIPYSF